MANAAAELAEGTAIQEVGSLERGGASLTVVTPSGRYQARRAVSCLVQPETDDVVLVSTAADGRCWVLAVLEREAGAGATLSVDGDLRLRPDNGRVAIASQKGVDIASGSDISVVAATIDVNAVDGSVVLQRLSFLGRRLRSEVEKIKTVAGTFDMVLDRFSQTVKRSYRRVEEMDQLRAERIDHRADKTMSLRGENTLMTAEQLVKVDGDQIHLG